MQAAESSFFHELTARKERGYAHRLLRTLHYILAPTHNLPPMPDEFHPIPQIDRELVPLASGSHLNTSQPAGFYESCYVGPESYGRQGWISTNDSLNTAMAWHLPPRPSGFRDNESRQWDHELICEKDYDKLAPKLSTLFREKLAKTEMDGDTSLVLLDPGQAGWLAHFQMWSHVGRPSIDPAVPRGVRFFPRKAHATSPTPPFDHSLHPLVLFVPGAFVRSPDVFPITMMVNITANTLTEVLDVCAQVAFDTGASRLEAWGLEPDDEVTKRWMDLGGKLSSRAETRVYPFSPFGWCWYGPEGSKGRLIGAEMWINN